MEESILDFATQATTALEAALSANSDDLKDNLILEHIKKLSSDLGKYVLDLKEKAEWVTGVKDRSLAAYCLGRVSLIDFFTYCCINCQQVIPDLHDLENLYSVEDGLVVVGVHSAKFEAERNPENVLHAAQRLGLTHPILNDPQAQLWERLGVRCWPTLLLLNPMGKPLLVLAGEGHRDILFRCVSVALNYFRAEGKLKPMQGLSSTDGLVQTTLQSTARSSSSSSLKFPGKVTLNPFCTKDKGEPWITISDSGNNRIILIDKNDAITHVIGGTDSGLKDGTLKESRFNNPQGICWLDTATFVVCDTGNHALRRISLNASTVELLAGTGVQNEFGDQGGLKYCQQSLSSPWDVVLYKTPDMDLTLRSPTADGSKDASSNSNDNLRRILLVAAAGAHQIWGVFLDTTVWWKYKSHTEGNVVALVGSGREENRNNRYPNSVGLAQPSGIVLAGDKLYIADSESSTIRRLDLSSGQVTALVGGDRNPCNLFAYGDLDGNGYSVRLQHPLGVTFIPSTQQVVVADSYNHKIKVIEPTTGECTTEYPTDNSKIKLAEPGGLCATPTGQRIYVADTNNHRIVTIDLETKSCSVLKNIDLPKVKQEKKEDYSAKNLIKCELNFAVCTSKGSTLIVFLLCETEKGEKELHLTPQAPQRWSVKFLNPETQDDVTSEWDLAGGIRSGKEFPGRLEAKLKSGMDSQLKRTMRIEYFLSLCEGGLCFVRRFAVDCHVTLKSDTNNKMNYDVDVTLDPSGEIKAAAKLV